MLINTMRVLRYCFLVDKCLMFSLLVALSSISVGDTHTLYALYICLMLLLAGDIHPNPGPVSNVTQKKFSVCQLNVNSLYLRSDSNPTYKLDEMYTTLCLSHAFDVICVTESWLNPSIPDCNIELPGYILYRRDRSDGYGGVVIYVSNNVYSSVVPDMYSDVVENLWVTLQVGKKKVLVGAFYRPPNSDASHVSSFIDDFNNNLSIAYAKKPDILCITGDFNDRRFKWSDQHNNSDLRNLFYDTLSLNNLTQVINEPTHFTEHCSSLLDLLITDVPDCVERSGVLPPVGTCHHYPVYCVFNVTYSTDACFKRKIYLYNRADFNNMNDYLLNLPWEMIIDSNSSVDSNVENFYKVWEDICNYFVPNKSVIIRPRDKPWMTGSIRRLLRKRDRYHKMYRKTLNVTYLNLWKNARRIAKSEINKQKSKHTESVTDQLLCPTTSSKSFWKITKTLIGKNNTSEIPTLIDATGNKYVTSLQKAEHFAQYFAMQSSMPHDVVPQLPELYYVTQSRLSVIHVEPENVFKMLNSLDVHKSVGPDYVCNRLLKECAVALAEPLCTLFNMSLQRGIYPTEWKCANLTPLFKDKDKFIRTNYRPISLLSCISKCFENCVFIELYAYCVSNNLLTWKNSGFKHLDSTIYQLISIVHTISAAIDKGKYVSMVFLDISKAFDKVWHDGLLFKLKTFGIDGRLLLWFKSYLQNRKQRVIIKGHASSWYTTNSGVPQGSVLGPLLFLIFINDIDVGVLSEMRMFADDTMMFDVAQNISTSVSKINNDLNTLSTWAHQWRVTFNPEKTVYMVYSRSGKHVEHDPIVFSGVNIKQVTFHKHLGIVLNNRMSWENHVTYIVERVSTRINMMRRVQNVAPRNCLEVLYKSFVRPLFDYGDVLFPHISVTQCKRLEQIQRQAALICTNAYVRTPHILLLQELNWEQLSTRRKYHCLVLMFKIQKGLVPAYLSNMCPPTIEQAIPYRLRNRNNVSSFTCKYNAFSNSFFPSTIKSWNALDSGIRHISTVNMFKAKLHNCKNTANKLFSALHGRAAINHTRLRLGLSALNAHRCSFNFIDYSHCPKCGYESEDSIHYFLQCPAYVAERETMFATIKNIVSSEHVIYHIQTPLSRNQSVSYVKKLLNGDLNLIFEQNVCLFRAIEKYINETRRFI